MASDSIKIHIGAKDTASAVIQGVQARTIALGVAMGNLASKAIVGMINSMRGWIAEAIDAEKANTALDAALRGMGQYTPELAKQYRDLANAIQDETGASDESVKANIAQLTTLGVMSDKMGVATRSVAALAAMGRDGNMAMNAVARALNGDIAGFERFSPAVRNATTIAEKFAAADQMLAAGFEQQKAKLQTVGGAWEALQGRIGDAREDIIGAIFEGLKLGTTFNSMQASVGRFLKSDTFAGFTQALKDGAGYALDIAKAMTTKGGVAEIGTAIGNIILGALKDGAEYLGVKISNAFSGAKSMFGEARVKMAVMAGTDEAEARRVVYGTPAEFKGGNMDKAVADLNRAVVERAATVQAGTDEEADRIAEYEKAEAERKQQEEQSAAMRAAGLQAQQKLDATATERQRVSEHTLTLENATAAAAERERTAKEAAAGWAEKRAALAAQSINEFIGAAVAGRAAGANRDKADALANKRAERLQDELKRNGKLSKVNQEFLDDWNKKRDDWRKAFDAEWAAKQAAIAAEAERKRLQVELDNWQRAVKGHLASIDNQLTDALEVQN